MKAKILALATEKRTLKVLPLEGENKKALWVSFNGKTKVPEVKKGDIIEIDVAEKNGKYWINKIEIISSTSQDKTSEKTSAPFPAPSLPNGSSNKDSSVIALSLLKTASELLQTVQTEKNIENYKKILQELLEIYREVKQKIG